MEIPEQKFQFLVHLREDQYLSTNSLKCMFSVLKPKIVPNVAKGEIDWKINLPRLFSKI